MLIVIMMNVIMLSVIMLDAVMLSVIMQNVVAPRNAYFVFVLAEVNFINILRS
jgi:hypothetical protein